MAGPSFEFVPHTADVAVRMRAPTLEGLFAVAAAACTEALTDRSAVRTTDSRRLTLGPAEPDLLLVDWLHEVLYLFESEGFLVRRAEVSLAPDDTGAWTLDGQLRGEPRDAERHGLKLLIKAVTYHGLTIARDADGYSATVVFDV